MSRLAVDLLRRHRVTEHLHGAAVLMHQPHQDADGGRLAGAVGADEAHDAAGGELEVDVVEREVGVVLAHALEVDGQVGHAFLLG